MRKILIGFVIGGMVATLALIGVVVAGSIKLGREGFHLLNQWKQQEDTTTKAFPAQGLRAIELDTRSADVEVLSGDVPAVQLSVHRMATGESDSDAKANLKNMQWSSVVEKGVLKVRQGGETESNSFFSLTFNDKNVLFNVRDFKFTVTVPKNHDATLRVHTLSGDVDFKELKAGLEVETDAGDVELHGGEGTTAVQTRSGDVKVSQRSGDSLGIMTQSGDVELDVGSASVKATTLQTQSGDVQAILSSKADLDLAFVTMSGSIDNRFKSGDADDAKEVHQVLNKGTNFFKVKTLSGDISVKPE